MKNTILLLPLAFVLGGLAGAWGPVAELRELKARPAKDSVSTGGRTQGFDAFARLVNIPDVARHRPRRTPAAPQKPKAGDSAPAQTPAVAESPAKESPAPAPRRPSPEDLRARIEEAAELWRTRSELVRAQSLTALGIDESGAAAFDAAVAKMNDELRASMQAIADALAGDGEMTPELGVRLMGDLSTTMAEAYDALGANVDPSHRDDVSKLNLAELIDPSVATPLIDVQGKLESFRPVRQRSRAQ